MVMASRWLVAVATTLVVGGMVVSSLAAGRDEDHREQLVAFVAAHERVVRSPRRAEVLHGEGHDGDAMVFYEVANHAMAQRSARGLPDGVWWGQAVTAGSREAAWPALEPIVAALRVGAQGRMVTVPKRGLDWHRLRGVLDCAQRRAADRGERGEEVALWLDAARFHLDVAWVWTQWPMDGFSYWSVARLSALDRGSAAVLAEGLRRLDGSWPRQVDLERSIVGAARPLLADGAGRRVSVRQRLGAWRSGFDPRRRELAGLVELCEALPELRVADVPWPQRLQQWREFTGHVRLGRGAAAVDWITQLSDTERRQRADLARLRLLRLALAFTFGEPLPELADPFAAAPLQARIDGDVATFHSAATPQVLQVQALRR